MNLTGQIAKNTSFHLGGKIISLFLSLATFAFIARYLGQAGFGQFTTIMAYLQAFAIFSDLGLYMIFIQMLSQPGADEKILASNFFTFRIVSSLALLTFGVLLSLFIPQYSHLIKIGIAITAISFLFGSLIQLLTGFFQKKLQIMRVVYAELMGRIILVSLVVLAIYFDLGFYFILGAIVIGGFIHFLLLYLFSLKFIIFKFRFDFSLWIDIFKKTWPVGLSIILTTIYFKGDTIILSLFKSSEEVGIYGAAYRMLEALIMLPPIFMGLVLSPLSRAWLEKDFSGFKEIFQQSFDFFMVLIIPLIVGVLFLAEPLMVLVAGEEFAVSSQPLKILIFATAFIFLGSLVTHTIIAMEKQKSMLKFYFLSAAIALIGYLFFIPKYSYTGAAYITVAVEFLVTFFAFMIIWQTIKFFPSLRILFRALLAGLIMGVVLYFLIGINLFLLIILSILVYFISLYFLKGISKKTIKEILSLKQK